MLKLLRRKKLQKRIFYLLAAIIIPAFVIWGSASVINKNKTPDYAGVIFGKKVSFDKFQNALHGWQIQMRLQYGEKAAEISNAFFNPVDAAWDRLILLQESKARKIKVKDSEIIDMITGFQFLQKDGRFDPQMYELFLKYSLGEQARIFEEKLRENIAMSKLFDQVTKETTASEDEIRQEYEKQNINTRVKYVFFPSSGYKNKIAVSEDEVKTYYEAHRENFMVPPKVNAEYIGIELKQDPSEQEKTEAREKIKKAAAQSKTTNFTEAAKESGLETKETGSFGLQDPIPGFGWMPQLSGLLFDLPVGQAKVVELDRGIYLFRTKEKKDSYVPDFNEAKEKARDSLLNEKSREMAQKNATAFIDLLNTKTVPFEEAAKKDGLEIKETPFFSREGYIPELGMAEALKKAAFKLSKDQTCDEPIELQQGFYVIKSIETQPIDEEKYKKEKEDFSNQLLENKRNKAFSDYFAFLKKKAGLINYIEDSMVKQSR